MLGRLAQRSLVWLLGSYALVFGVLYIIAGLRLKGAQPAQRPPGS